MLKQNTKNSAFIYTYTTLQKLMELSASFSLMSCNVYDTDSQLQIRDVSKTGTHGLWENYLKGPKR